MVSHFAQEKTKEHKLAKPQQQPNSLDSEKLYAKDRKDSKTKLFFATPHSPFTLPCVFLLWTQTFPPELETLPIGEWRRMAIIAIGVVVVS